MEEKKKLRFDYKWVVIASCFLMIMLTLGFASSTRSLFTDEIAEALGVPRSLVAVGDSFRFITTALINAFFGILVYKFGPKKLIAGGFISLISSMLVYSLAENIILIFIAGILMGIGFSWTSTAMVGYVVGIWCSENKGTIMGIVLASNGIGGAVAIQIVGSLIDPDVTGSYRAAYRLIAVVLAITFLLVMIMFRDRPKGVRKEDIAPPKKHAKKKRGRDWEGLEFSELVHRPYFWAALVCIFLTGFVLQGSHGIIAMHYKDVGIDYGRVKGLLSFGSLILAGAKFLTGFVYDKGGLRVAANVCMVLAIASTFLLAVIKGDDLGFILAIIYAIIAQCSLPLETIMLPIYASDLFGRKSYAKVLGLITSVNVAGYAVGAPLMNLSYDLLGSYVVGLVAVGCVMTAVFIVLQFVMSAAHKEQARLAALREKETEAV